MWASFVNTIYIESLFGGGCLPYRAPLSLVPSKEEGTGPSSASTTLGKRVGTKITVSLHYRLGLLPACLLTTRTNLRDIHPHLHL